MKRKLMWHFTNGWKLRTGEPLPPPGVTLHHEKSLKLCRSGLHASPTIFSALNHAPGLLLHRVTLSGIEGRDSAKAVGRERTILWSVDAVPILLRFARLCVLDVIHLWDAPDVVVEFLKTGDSTEIETVIKKADLAVPTLPDLLLPVEQLSVRWTAKAAGEAARAVHAATHVRPASIFTVAAWSKWAAEYSVEEELGSSEWYTATRIVRKAVRLKQTRRLAAMVAAAPHIFDSYTEV